MIKKIFEKDQSYYRFPLHGTVVYFSHAIKVKEEEYISLGFKDLILKIDELVGEIQKIGELDAKIEALNSASKKLVEDQIKKDPAKE